MAGQAQNNARCQDLPQPRQLQLLCRHSCLQAQTPRPWPKPGAGARLHALCPLPPRRDTSCGSQAIGKQQGNARQALRVEPHPPEAATTTSVLQRRKLRLPGVILPRSESL